MNSSNFRPEMIFSADGYTAHVDHVMHAEEKSDKLHRHAHPRIGSVRVRVTRETPHFAPPRFSVCVIARRAGSDCVTHAVADEPIPAIDEAFEKLERLITAVSSERKSARRHPHPIELEAALGEF